MRTRGVALDIWVSEQSLSTAIDEGNVVMTTTNNLHSATTSTSLNNEKDL